MAGSLIQMPANGAADWSDFVTITQESYKEFQYIILSNTTNDSEPKIQAGSRCVVNGAMYKFEVEESITGWASIANNTQAWIKLVPAGSSITAAFTDSAPTYDADKGGYYSTNDRYVAEIFRGASSAVYGEKNIITWKPGEIATRKLRIGDWDMDATTTVNIPHNISSYKTIRKISVVIRDDSDVSYIYHANAYDHASTSTMGLTLIRISSIHGIQYVSIDRVPSGWFDNVDHDATSYNRGWVIIEYEAS